MAVKKTKAKSSNTEPNKSPNAVKYGMAELSGSILFFHIKCIIICAIYKSVQICDYKERQRDRKKLENISRLAFFSRENLPVMS